MTFLSDPKLFSVLSSKMQKHRVTGHVLSHIGIMGRVSYSRIRENLLLWSMLGLLCSLAVFLVFISNFQNILYIHNFKSRSHKLWNYLLQTQKAAWIPRFQKNRQPSRNYRSVSFSVWMSSVVLRSPKDKLFSPETSPKPSISFPSEQQQLIAHTYSTAAEKLGIWMNVADFFLLQEALRPRPV